MTRTEILLIALTPYASCLAVDAWMHERARQVPWIEQGLHGGLALGIGAFIVAVFLGYIPIAWYALGCSIVLMIWDELGYHKHLSHRERTVHLLAFFALLGFIGAWRYADSQP